MLAGLKVLMAFTHQQTVSYDGACVPKPALDLQHSRAVLTQQNMFSCPSMRSFLVVFRDP